MKNRLPFKVESQFDQGEPAISTSDAIPVDNPGDVASVVTKDVPRQEVPVHEVVASKYGRRRPAHLVDPGQQVPAAVVIARECLVQAEAWAASA